RFRGGGAAVRAAWTLVMLPLAARLCRWTCRLRRARRRGPAARGPTAGEPPPSAARAAPVRSGGGVAELADELVVDRGADARRRAPPVRARGGAGRALVGARDRAAAGRAVRDATGEGRGGPCPRGCS